MCQCPSPGPIVTRLWPLNSTAVTPAATTAATLPSSSCKASIIINIGGPVTAHLTEDCYTNTPAIIAGRSYYSFTMPAAPTAIAWRRNSYSR